MQVVDHPEKGMGQKRVQYFQLSSDDPRADLQTEIFQ